MTPIPGFRSMLLVHHDHWFQTIPGVIATAILMLPVLPMVVVALAGVRRRRGGRQPWRTAVLDVGILYGTGIPIWLTMVPGGNSGLSLVPFRDMATTPRYEIVGNLLLLSALSFLGPIRFRSLTYLRVVPLAMLVSITIETCQYVLPIGRVASVDDVLLNTTGAAIAAILSWPWWASGRYSLASSAGSPASRLGSKANGFEVLSS